MAKDDKVELTNRSGQPQVIAGHVTVVVAPNEKTKVARDHPGLDQIRAVFNDPTRAESGDAGELPEGSVVKPSQALSGEGVRVSIPGMTSGTGADKATDEGMSTSRLIIDPEEAKGVIADVEDHGTDLPAIDAAEQPNSGVRAETTEKEIAAGLEPRFAGAADTTTPGTVAETKAASGAEDQPAVSKTEKDDAAVPAKAKRGS